MGSIRRVGVLMNLSHAWWREIVLGFARYSSIHGNWELYMPPPFYLAAATEEMTLAELCDMGIDGVLLGSQETSQVVMGLPNVVQGDLRNGTSQSSHIEGDNVEVGKMGAKYFIDLGFRELAFCGFGEFTWSSARRAGFQATAAANSCAVHCYKHPTAHSQSWSDFQHSWTEEKDLMAEWIRSLPKPIGLMACNDYRARQVVDVCRNDGIIVPEEIAVLGVDNDEAVCTVANLPISSVSFNLRKGGYEAAGLLDRIMSDPQMAHQDVAIMPTHIVTRASTDIVAISDPDVANAVRFIRDNSRKPIQVSQVSNAVAMTSRSLRRRFRAALGRSVAQTIASYRMEQVSRLLIETDWPVSRVASEVGYSDITNMARRFRKARGMTPVAYRKKYGLRIDAR